MKQINNCPTDPNKAEPGQCGYGNPDPDTDGDGTIDDCDNCPAAPNVDQTDSNGNGIGDACEPPPVRRPRTTAAAAMAWTG